MKRRFLWAIIAVMLAIPGVPFTAADAAADENIVVAFQGSPKVELYITGWCPYCREAVDFFKARGIYFDLYDIEKDEKAALRKNELDGRRGVPFAVINGQKIHGYSEQAYLKALELK